MEKRPKKNFSKLFDEQTHEQTNPHFQPAIFDMQVLASTKGRVDAKSDQSEHISTRSSSGRLGNLTDSDIL